MRKFLALLLLLPTLAIGQPYFQGANLNNPQGGTGTGVGVRATSPTLVTPTLGAATATSITFSPTTSGILGATDGSAACAGCVGEILDSSVTAQTISTTIANLTSKALTAGTWDISASISTSSGSTNTWVACNINATTATFSGNTAGKDLVYGAIGAGAIGSCVIPRIRVSVSGTTTYYLNSQVSTTSISTVNGYLSAVRVR